MNDEMKVMRGNPVEIVLGGERVLITRMTISQQLDMVDMFQSISPEMSENSTREGVEFMIKIISLITGIPAQDINDMATIDEVADAYSLIYEREILPLMKGAEKLSSLTAQQQ